MYSNRSIPYPPCLQQAKRAVQLEYAPNNTHNMVFRSLLLLRVRHLLNASPSSRRRNTIATNSELPLPHPRVNINILQLDVQGAVGGALEPAVSFPRDVQEQEQGAGEVELEERLGVEIRAADGVQGDVELGDEGDGVDQDADVGAVDAEGGLVGEFV
jgi:hypothetical protein